MTQSITLLNVTCIRDNGSASVRHRDVAYSVYDIRHGVFADWEMLRAHHSLHL